ncbi:3300_t:CDS:2 [Acaulospora colombiana]|uniref:3300_t:CDS:1 n=1 Tax=Acaulospora colombiana TaxID=27376 RepID=A0ACA9LIT1_9GLOM|nr:3300_t:CDS:2 [Acaulospora colombiana]
MKLPKLDVIDRERTKTHLRLINNVNVLPTPVGASQIWLLTTPVFEPRGMEYENPKDFTAAGRSKANDIYPFDERLNLAEFLRTAFSSSS